MKVLSVLLGFIKAVVVKAGVPLKNLSNIKYLQQL